MEMKIDDGCTSTSLNQSSKWFLRMK